MIIICVCVCVWQRLQHSPHNKQIWGLTLIKPFYVQFACFPLASKGFLQVLLITLAGGLQYPRSAPQLPTEN